MATFLLLYEFFIVHHSSSWFFDVLRTARENFRSSFYAAFLKQFSTENLCILSPFLFFWWVLDESGMFWMVLVGAGGFWWALVDSGGTWSVPDGPVCSCWFWCVLVGSGWFWMFWWILDDSGGFW